MPWKKFVLKVRYSISQTFLKIHFILTDYEVFYDDHIANLWYENYSIFSENFQEKFVKALLSKVEKNMDDHMGAPKFLDQELMVLANDK